jgi:hopanoid biosynthesis associated RND transporter like protein HpnN
VIVASVAGLVDLARRHAIMVALVGLALALAAALYAATHLVMDTDLEHLLPDGLAWRQDEAALDRAFPQNDSLIVVVIDATSGDAADRAAGELAGRLKAEPDLFRYVRRPDGGAFFDQNGLLFLPVDELQAMSSQLVEAQPLIGTMAHDPSLRGLFDTLALFASHAAANPGAIQRLGPTLAAIADGIDGVIAGRDEPVPWQRLMTGRPPDKRELRHFVVARPVLDFAALEPGARAEAEIHRLAGEYGLDAQHGIRVRLTGPVPLNDDQFATLRKGAVRSTLLSVGLVIVILLLALRSPKLVVAILTTLIAGLLLTAGFAALAIGSLNLISVAFGVLFIGLAVDFGIQFGVRYRDRRHLVGTLPGALDGTARTIGPALLLAAGATAIGFLAFVPTRYTGIRELGWIAGAGMLIAIALTFVLLPALLTVLRPRGEPEPIGFRRLAPLDRLLQQRRRWVFGGAAILAVAGIALLPQVSFDFDPLDLKNPHSEALQTARDLMRDPMTTPYTAEVLTPSQEAAEAIAKRLNELPEVAQTVTAASFIPKDQDKKLDIIGDLALLLGPTLTPVATLPPPTETTVVASMAACRDALRKVAPPLGPGSPAARLADALDHAVSRGQAIVPALRAALMAGLEQRLATLRRLIGAKSVSLADLPPELRDGWIAPDGRARVEVFPKGDARDPAVLEKFVAAVRTVAPNATGTPVTIQEAGHLISSAFVQAGIIAVVAITVLLMAVLRRARDVALVVAPLLLAGVLTMATTVVIGTKLNYANITALPLLLGIGVAFDIYFVMNWRAGQSNHLQSSTARAVIFSALTTMSAFGSLALSPDPGTSAMGGMLTIALLCTLFCTLFVLPALLGPPLVETQDTQMAKPRSVQSSADRSP